MKRSIKNYDYEKMFRRLGGLISDRKNTDIEWRTYFYECFFGEKKICFKSISCFSLRYKSFCLQTFHELSSFEFLINLFWRVSFRSELVLRVGMQKFVPQLRSIDESKDDLMTLIFVVQASGWLRGNFILKHISIIKFFVTLVF